MVKIVPLGGIILKNAASFLKNIFLFKPEKEKKPFILVEEDNETEGADEESQNDDRNEACEKDGKSNAGDKVIQAKKRSEQEKRD